jgi:hypothetical protein
MGTYNTRLSAQLTFDDEREKDIVNFIEQLNATHKTGQFVSNLIRLVFEKPEIVKDFGSLTQFSRLASNDIEYYRRNFFESLTNDISEMKRKVDDIYDMAMKTYTLAQMGKRIGLEEKSDNEMLACFVLERQLKEIRDKLGISIRDPIYSSDKLDTSHERAEDVLEYIINSYDSIINELTSRMTVQTVAVPMNTVPIQSNLQPVENIVQSVEKESTNDNISVSSGEKDVVIDFGETPENTEDNTDRNIDGNTDSEVDFSNADLSALSDFFFGE